MKLFITGTGTNIGKTIFSAAIMTKYGRKYGIHYHKPIQTGDESDTETVQQLSGLNNSHFQQELYHFSYPASPHYAANLQNQFIDSQWIQDSLATNPAKNLLIEGAGGLFVPLNQLILTIDLLARLKISTILVGSTTLGTINHTLLSLEALQKRQIPVVGFFLCGPTREITEDNQKIISHFSGQTCLGTMAVPEPVLKQPTTFYQFCSQQFDKQGMLEALF